MYLACASTGLRAIEKAFVPSCMQLQGKPGLSAVEQAAPEDTDTTVDTTARAAQAWLMPSGRLDILVSRCAASAAYARLTGVPVDEVNPVPSENTAARIYGQASAMLSLHSRHEPRRRLWSVAEQPHTCVEASIAHC